MNISSIKSSDVDSPKTPGGISKTLLTPCRRLGLSRKWRKGSVSPFISPVPKANKITDSPCSSQDNPVRKRKKCDKELVEKDIEDNSSLQISDNSNTPEIIIDRTPTRVILPRKKSKSVLTTQKCQEEAENIPQSISELNKNNIDNLQQDTETHMNEDSNISADENTVQEAKQVIKVSKLSRNISKNSKFKPAKSPAKNIQKNNHFTETSDNKDVESRDTKEVSSKLQLKTEEIRCPNNLSKECVVVIQKKIFKSIKNNTNNYRLSPKHKKEKIPNQKSSQTLFDSDSDDIPLANFNKANIDIINIQKDNRKEISQVVEKKIQNTVENLQKITDLTNKNLDDDDDFVDKKKVNVKRVEKTTSTTGLKSNIKEKPKKSKPQMKQTSKPSSQSSNSIDSDDDFDYSKTRTILIKKSYDKVTKPLKAKSTGSITQKDIDEITARIESKKNLLLAKAMTTETKELRDLIKKWQLGCQRALMDLLDLMKQKLDKNVEHSELLEMLKIPPGLVGYDSDNDCFNTPDDTSIILTALKID